MMDRDLRLRRIRRRLLIQVAFGLLCNVLLFLVLSRFQEPPFIPDWMRIAGPLAVLNIMPLLIVERWNWTMGRRAVSDMRAFGQLNFDEVSRELAARKAVEADIKDCKPYIEVMHEQIGDSLAESEREVVVVIEQIDTLMGKTGKQREHIARSVKSAGELTENTQIRVENNKGVIAAIEMQLEAQTGEFRSNFERIKGWRPMFAP